MVSFRDDPALLRVVRDAIYGTIASTAAAPTTADVARAHGIDEQDVAAAYRTLADSHVIVLKPGTHEVWSAPPFSAVPTAFRVQAGDKAWYAPCAWDAFGIPAALKRSTTCAARCAWSGDPLSCGVNDGASFGDGLIHLLVPAAHFWDDIVHT